MKLFFFMVKTKCEKNDFKQNEDKKHVLVYFFKWSFVLRFGVVIFELYEASISDFVEFRL